MADNDDGGEQMLKLLRRFPQDLEKGFREGKKIDAGEVGRFNFGGMGGSGAFADIIKSIFDERLPIRVIKGYSLPGNAAPGELLVATTYSGTTEETLELMEEAKKRCWNVIVSTSGRELIEKSENEEILVGKMPEGRPPRFAFPFSFGFAVGLVHQALPEEMQVDFSLPELDMEALEAIGKDVALDIGERTPIICSHGFVFETCHRWASQMAENSKELSWTEKMPEMNHNQIVGWCESGKGSRYALVMLRDYGTSDRMNERYMHTARLIESAENPARVIIIDVGSEDTVISAALESVLIGDFASVYLGLEKGVDPEPVESISKLKKMLGRN